MNPFKITSLNERGQKHDLLSQECKSTFSILDTLTLTYKECLIKGY